MRRLLHQRAWRVNQIGKSHYAAMCRGEPAAALGTLARREWAGRRWLYA
ncbi:MAG: hypothetical protein M1423_06700 [Acidobacteria bacterium]|nr:hypothetical protein [Acidobacteriota bacterium]